MCRRCQHVGHANTDGLCRACLTAIRCDDPTWITDPRPGGSCQLGLILPGLRLPSAQPLDRPVHGRPRQDRPRSWLERLRTATAEPIDDARVLPPAPPGQLALFLCPRHLTNEHEQRLRGRLLRGQDVTKAAALALAADRGKSKSYAHWLARTLRLALAVRDADGENLVPQDILDDLPRFAAAVGELLRAKGMLGPRRELQPGQVRTPRRDIERKLLARGCVDCDCWAVRAQPRCVACHAWKYSLKHPVGVCTRCRRAGAPVRDGLCRACSAHIQEHGLHAAAESGTQLWFGGSLALRLVNRAGALGYSVPHHRARQRAAARRPPRPPVSDHLVDPAQGALFDLRRDWSCLRSTLQRQLPTLTPTAARLVVEFEQRAKDRGWDEQIRRLATRNLRIMLAWIGADAPIHEADIRALCIARPGPAARRLLQFLTEHRLVIPDPQRAIGADQRWIEQHIGELPGQIAEEIRRWILVLRGEGRRRHRAMSFNTIRKYLGYIHPVFARLGRADQLTTGDHPG